MHFHNFESINSSQILTPHTSQIHILDIHNNQSYPGEVEETLGDLILNNVVDQLLDGTLPSSSAASILVSSSQEDMDSMDVVSRPIPISNEGSLDCHQLPCQLPVPPK